MNSSLAAAAPTVLGAEPVTPEVLATDPPLALLKKKLTVRALEPHEYQRAGQLLDQEHYLGDLPQGRQLLQVVEYDGQWAALLDWGPAAVKLADREEWIGWTAQQRAERLPLVVQQRRFLVLSQARRPNFASQAQALALRALPGQWEAVHGYRPLLAETFSDLEAYAGTCYKVSNWMACGQTKGFARHRPDYYRRHDRPKKLWLKTLNRNARRLLTAMELPPNYQQSCTTDAAERDLPLKKAQLESLADFLRHNVPDPRRSNRSLPAWSLLTVTTMGLLAGRDSLAAIQRYGLRLTQTQRGWLGFGRKKGTAFRKAPSYTALRNLLHKLDPHQLADCLNQWLQANLGTLPRALAIDGKWIRDRALSVCLSEHETGAPVAVGFARELPPGQDEPAREAFKREGEQTVALRLYATTNLHNATVTGDALNNNQPQAQAVLDAGGDYLFQLKNEQRHAHRAAVRKAATTPLLPTRKRPTRVMAAATSVG